VVCFRPSVELPVSLRHSLVRLTSPLTQVVSFSAVSYVAVADKFRYFVARCRRYLAIGFDDGVLARRDEEEADVLVDPNEDVVPHIEMNRGLADIHAM